MTTKTSRGWTIALWVVQALLALAFTASGLMKLVTPYTELAAKMAWAAQTDPGLVKFIGAAELAGVLGLILPAATRLVPVLTPVAASLLAVVMVLAAGKHLSLDEPSHVVPNVVLGGLAVFVAFGRFKKAPVAARGKS